MKAIVITAPGDGGVLKLVERPVPQFTDDEVLIRVKASGVNRLDILQRQGKYPVPPGVSAEIPGVEVSGVIERCGSAVKRWVPGDHVCALLPGAGYAEFVAVDEGSVLPIPKGLSFAEAGALPETVFTVWHNVFQRGNLKAGENFLVHGGSSGIGITAIQLAKAFGSSVYATAGNDEKCEACEAHGADMCINYKKQDFESILIEIGIDVVLDMVGGSYTPKNINVMRPEGRLVFINSQHSSLQANVFAIMQKRLNITGSTLRGRDLKFKAQLASEILQHVWPLIEAGTFKSVIYQKFSFDEVSEAHTVMESSRHIGKLVLEW